MYHFSHTFLYIHTNRHNDELLKEYLSKLDELSETDKFATFNDNGSSYTILEFAIIHKCGYLAELIRLTPIEELAGIVDQFLDVIINHVNSKEIITNLLATLKQETIDELGLKAITRIFSTNYMKENMLRREICDCHYVIVTIEGYNECTIKDYIASDKEQRLASEIHYDRTCANLIKVDTDVIDKSGNSYTVRKTTTYIYYYYFNNLEKHEALCDIVKQISKPRLRQLYLILQNRIANHIDDIEKTELPYSIDEILNLIIDAVLSTKPLTPIRITLEQGILARLNETNITLYLSANPEIEAKISKGNFILDNVFLDKEFLHDQFPSTPCISNLVLNKFLAVILRKENFVRLASNVVKFLNPENQKLYFTMHPHSVDSLGVYFEHYREHWRTILRIVLLPKLWTTVPEVIIEIISSYLKDSFALIERVNFEKDSPMTSPSQFAVAEAKGSFFKESYAVLSFKLVRQIAKVKDLYSFYSNKPQNIPQVISFLEDRYLSNRPFYNYGLAHLNNLLAIQKKYLLFAIKKWESKVKKASETKLVSAKANRFGLEISRNFPQLHNGFFLAIFEQLTAQKLQIIADSMKKLYGFVVEEFRTKHYDFDVRKIHIDNESMLNSVSSALAVSIVIISSDTEPRLIKHPDPITTLYLGFDAANCTYKSLVWAKDLQKVESLEEYFDDKLINFMI